MRRQRSFYLWPVGLSLVLAFASACGDTSQEPDEAPEVPEVPGEVVQSDIERDVAPDVSAQDQAAFVAGNTAFAIDAYHALIAVEDSNIFYSPLSISTALAMTYGGARGNTEAEMASVLHYDLPPTRLHAAFNWLDLELQSRGQGAQGSDGDGFRLNLANATFGQQGYTFLDEYLDLLALNYGAGMALLNFGQEPEASRQVINQWVADKTEDRIPELLPECVFKSGATLVLVNAVYFNAAWASPFRDVETAPGAFQTLTGEVTVPMMRGGGGSYSEGAGYTAVSLPYDGNELDMVLIVPDEGTFESFEASLDAATLSAILNPMTSQGAEIIMPSFEFSFKTDLGDALQAMGMVDAFESSLADFSGMDGQRGLAISSVIHEAFINVNEAGTEAAASTAVITIPPSVPPTFTVDRPFVLLIRDRATQTVVFIGRVVDPS